MNIIELKNLKKRLLALGMSGVMIGSSGCSLKDENGIPKKNDIPSNYSNIEDYYKYAVKNGKAEKLYNGKNVYLLYNKENYDVEEYLYNVDYKIGGLIQEVEVYDLESEEMLVYNDSITRTYNEEYYNYIRENNYQICLDDINDYIENYDKKEFYNIKEIKELEPQIKEGLMKINGVKEKTK